MPEIRIRKKGTVKSLAEIISPILRQSGLEEGMRLDIMRRRWDELFREPLSLHLYPASLNDGELLINVDSPTWLQEVTIHKKEILNVLRPFCIKDIRFRLGRAGFRREKIRSEKGYDREPERELTPQSVRFINETISPVKDDDLREVIRATIEKSLSCNRLKDTKS